MCDSFTSKNLTLTQFFYELQNTETLFTFLPEGDIIELLKTIGKFNEKNPLGTDAVLHLVPKDSSYFPIEVYEDDGSSLTWKQFIILIKFFEHLFFASYSRRDFIEYIKNK